MNKLILNEAKKIQNDLIRYREYFHMNPEIGFNTKGTTAFIKVILDKNGIQYSDCGQSGLVAYIGDFSSDNVFLLRADIDALPIKEETTISCKSRNKAMHACGHDFHAAMLLGASRILKKHEKEINGLIKLVFQPAEEILEGAKDMIKSGVLDNPKVKGALMMHVLINSDIPTGTIIVSKPGIGAPAASYFEIKIKGKGCHGSMPNMGIDPLNIAAHTLIALQTIQTRELSINDHAALTIGKIEGGTANNIIPECAYLKGTMRCEEELTYDYMKKRIIEISKSTAKTFKATAQIKFVHECPNLLNDETLSSKVENYVKELLNDKAICVSELAKTGIKKTSSGSEDFAYISHQIPSIMLALSCGEYKDGYCYPLHHPKALFDEKALYIGCATYAYVALRYLQDN